jgi:hypothetical protein
MAFPTVVQGSPGYDKTATTTQKHRLGTKMTFPDGRVFYYSYAAGAITAGKLTMGSATATDHIKDLVVAEAAAAGANQIKLTNGATTAITGSGKYTGNFGTRGDYVDGYVFINDADGEGQVFQIADHSDAATGATLTIDLYDNDSVQTALTTSSEAGLHKPVGHSVVVLDADAVGSPALGVPTHDIASGEYFWNQTAGPAAVLSVASLAVGKEAYSSTTDGAVGPSAADNSGKFRVGRVLAAGADTEYSLIDLQIRA